MGELYSGSPQEKREVESVCVNLKKVNATIIRDHYLLPITDHVLERVARRQAYSFLDKFLSYNKVLIKQED